MKIGACWKKQMKDGCTFLSGILEIGKLAGSTAIPEDTKINIAIFPTKEKKSDRSPDFEIVYNDGKPKGSILDSGEDVKRSVGFY